MYETVKRYYNMGKYTDEQMKVFVKAKYITEEQYLELTGIEYVA